jgi:glutathione S-transferase
MASSIPLELFGFPQSNFVRMVRIVCHEKGVEYTLDPQMPRTKMIRALNPTGKVPAMRHGDLVLWESKAIATYIDRTFPGPKMIPDDPVKGALVEQWVSFVNTSLDPLAIRQVVLSYVFPTGPDGLPDRAAIDPCIPRIGRLFGMLSDVLAEREFLVGGTFTLADADLLPILSTLRAVPEGPGLLKESPVVASYLARHLQRPSMVATEPPPL